MSFLKLGKYFFILVGLFLIAETGFAQPGPPPVPEDVPISNLAILLLLLAKGLGIYKIYQSKKKK